jgi:hypothetical protein
MTDNNFDLLQRKYPEDAAGKNDNPEIKLARDKARTLRKENNELVHRIWAIEAKLNKSPLPAEEIVSLSKEKDELTLRVENEKYAEKIASLVDEINRLAGIPEGHNNSPSSLLL